jgi:hypothetical protein
MENERLMEYVGDRSQMIQECAANPLKFVAKEFPYDST